MKCVLDLQIFFEKHVEVCKIKLLFKFFKKYFIFLIYFRERASASSGGKEQRERKENLKQRLCPERRADAGLDLRP